MLVKKQHLTVSVIVEENGKYLIIEEEISGKRYLNQPAGHVEFNETLQEAVIREVKEETGYCFIPESILGVYQSETDTDQFFRFMFIGKVEKPTENVILDPVIKKVLWMSNDDISSSSIALRGPIVLSSINDYESGKRFPLQVIC